MRPAVNVATGISAVIITLLALKPHQLPALDGVSRAPSASSSLRSTPSAAPSGGVSTGTGKFTGDPIDTPYGTVQVAATLAKGKLTAVKVLKAPDQNGRDQQIANYALPRLTQEALGAQSAHIDVVSGASYTSQGYIQSLQSALDQAGA
ncbi:MULTISPECIES: FMN-binding protein [unclassified Streptomyces]|uniref:FMN-binding protein n=1 Tax=unclassified Streptomyces TaxID=2593676 RepID=UPI0011CD8FCB|nr:MULTISPECIES: FMN-binding protein [unclassified Streptomyces]TXS59492.1 FMN-binding protein [Streptomyces sp. me109]